MTYGYPAPTGGGGGASAFTDLTDAPETITAGGFVVGNPAGDALQSPDWFVLDDTSTRQVQLFAEDPDSEGNGCLLGTVSGDTNAVASFYSDDTIAQVNIGFTGGGGVQLQVSAAGAELAVQGANGLKLTGLEVVATDTNARLTVDGVSYAPVKAIQVKIGEDTHFWPLYGGADAGPAPAPSIVETIVPNGVVVGNAAGDALVMSAAIAVSEAGVISIATDNAPAGDANDIHITGGDSVDGKGASVLLTAGAGTGETNPGSVTLDGKVTIQSTTQDLTITSHVTHLLSPAGVSVESDQLNVAAGSIHLDSTGDLRLKADDEAGITIDTPYTEIQTNTLSIYPNTGSDFAAPNNGQAVTFGTDIGPGGAAVSIKRWIPITVDGNEGWIPHFGV